MTILLGTQCSLNNDLNARGTSLSNSIRNTSIHPKSVAKTWAQVKFLTDFPTLLDENIVSENMVMGRCRYLSILLLYYVYLRLRDISEAFLGYYRVVRAIVCLATFSLTFHLHANLPGSIDSFKFIDFTDEIATESMMSLQN